MSNIGLLQWNPVKVSATLQDRPRADRFSVSRFYKNPYKPYIFESLIIPDYGFLLKKMINLNVFRKWEALCKNTCLYKSCSTPCGNKQENNQIFSTRQVSLFFFYWQMKMGMTNN